MSLPLRRLGASNLEVSVMALGSWKTFERMSRDDGVAVMRAAQEAGITFLDDARYDDDTGRAPIPTGWSEVVFGDLFRATGWRRDEVVVANKLWWEHWPEEDAAAELDGSLERMKFEYVDLIYAIHPPAGMAIGEVVEQVGSVLRSGRARVWGTGMWTATQHQEALDRCAELGVAPPVAAQMGASLLEHPASEPEMLGVLAEGQIGLVAANVLAGGVLTGKYERGEGGRAFEDGTSAPDGHAAVAREVVALASRWEVPPAHVAFAYAFAHPQLASVLFGSRTPEQVHQNAAAYETFTSLTADQLAAIQKLAH